MKAFCTDGTTVDCISFRAIDAGVLLFNEEWTEDDEDLEAFGFVPYKELRYVIPDDIQPATSRAQAPFQQQQQTQGQQPPGGVPPGQPPQ